MRLKLAVTILVFCVAALLSLGLVMLYSSMMADRGSHYVKIQLLWAGLGLICCAIATVVDYQIMKRFALPLLAVSVVLLVLVFVPPFGIHRNGASRWIGYHGVSFFQPSEVAKLVLIIVLAWYGERYQRQITTLKKGILIPGLIIALVLGLIFREPDRGTTILYSGRQRHAAAHRRRALAVYHPANLIGSGRTGLFTVSRSHARPADS